MKEQVHSLHKTEQQRIFIIKFFYLAIIAFLTWSIVKYALPVLAPFLIAGLIACILNRPIRLLCDKTHIRRPYILSLIHIWEEEASVSVNEARTAQDNVIGEGLEAGRISYQGRIYAYKSDVLTFLCMGIDRKGEVKASANPFKGGQADALFLVVLDPKDKRSSVIGINRDTMTEISTFDRNGLYAGKETAQLALAHAYGDGLEKSCENTVEAVSKLFYGLPVHGYCALNMSAISLLNDAVGGVDVVIPESGAGIMKDWKTGEQVHLDGKHAYTFIQYRDMALPRSAQARFCLLYTSRCV